jgi:hypothetical protein
MHGHIRSRNSVAARVADFGVGVDLRAGRRSDTWPGTSARTTGPPTQCAPSSTSSTARNISVHDHLPWLVWLFERWCLSDVTVPESALRRDRDPSGVGVDHSEDVV